MLQDGGTHRRPFKFPPDHIVDIEEAAMGWVLRLHGDEKNSTGSTNHIPDWPPFFTHGSFLSSLPQ